MRSKVQQLVEKKWFNQIITVLICLNAVTIGLETYDGIAARYRDGLRFIDHSILLFFTIEIGTKLYAYRLSFFYSGWNIFDFTIVAGAWVPTDGMFSILRSLRILRGLRMISTVPRLRAVIDAIIHSIPGMLSVMGVLCIIFYVGAVMATVMFGEGASPFNQQYFGSIGASALTLFQVMTLESWASLILRPLLEQYALAWLFFVPFIIVTSFTVLNLFIGVIVDAMQEIHKKEAVKMSKTQEISSSDADAGEGRDAFNERLKLVQKDIAEIKKMISQKEDIEKKL